jgi:adenylyltransferase/sulfurtransferase
MARFSALTAEQEERYNRQIILPQWGEEGQLLVRNATVFVAGAGGLGSAAVFYLAAAGVGCMRIVDDGEVERSNLNRQVLHEDDDIGKKKTLSAARSVSRVNPEVDVVPLDRRIDRNSVADLVGESCIIVDCLDNFETRYVLNAYAVKNGLPMVHAGVYAMAGQITFLQSPQTPCLECIFPEAPPSEVFPILGATAAVIGAMEALETLKYLTGTGTLLKNRLLIWEGDVMKFEEISIGRAPDCPVCGESSFER